VPLGYRSGRGKKERILVGNWGLKRRWFVTRFSSTEGRKTIISIIVEKECRGQRSAFEHKLCKKKEGRGHP